MTNTRQLTLDVAPHPDIAKREATDEPTWITGSLKLSGDLSLGEDLNPGDQLIVTVAGPDGDLITRGYFEVGAIALVPIREKDLGIVGTERVHKAKLTDET